MTSVPELVRSLREHVQMSASARTVYGDPVVVGRRTVIPIAHVRYGYGFGASGGLGEGPPAGRGHGLGGGAGMRASPVGALEITDARTRFIRFTDPQRLGVTMALAVLIGVAIGRRSSR